MGIVNDISLAQWSLVDEFFAGQWKTLDFAAIARNDFGLNGIELVNTLFEVPTERYLNQLRNNASDNGIANILIMIDDEGDGCAATKEGRKNFEIFHRKWVDIAHYLDCFAIRTNCRGPLSVNFDDALNWASESYLPLLDYASTANINILIENHGGVSNNAEWMIQLMEKINHPYFGTYPDWRTPLADFNNVEYLKKTVRYAKGMSYRNQPNDDLTIEMIQLCKDAGYHGWFGIESQGREEIRKGIKILKRELNIA